MTEGSAPGRHAPDLSAVVLNYGDPELTARAVERFRRAAEEGSLTAEIVVVDNSAPRTASALRMLLPDCAHVIENEENRGFAAAVNQGLRESRGHMVLLLNNDAFVDAPLLRRGVEHLSQHPRTGIWAPALVFEDGSHQASCARAPTLRGCLREYLLGLAPDRYPSDHRWTEPTPVETVTGAVMLLRRRTLERVGPLDERFFFNCEDVDLCVRIRAEGLDVVYDPAVRAVHLAGASSADRGWGEDPHLHRERIRYFRKHRGRLIAAAAAAVIGTGVILRGLLRPLRRRFGGRHG